MLISYDTIYTHLTKGVYKMAKIEVGDVFTTNQSGDCVVVGFDDNGEVVVRFEEYYVCDLSFISQNLKKGQVKNPYRPSVCGVGYMGVGRYISHRNGRHTPEYRVWRDMIKRCYNYSEHEKLPTYIGCTVHTDWHNFQNFAEWYTSQEYYGMGYDIDKDILFDGNKFYSPNTCVLVPQELNKLFNKRLAAKGLLPTGVSFYKKSGKYSAGLRIDGKRLHLGYFSNKEDAASEYELARKEYIRVKAIEWRSRIDEKLFEALILRTS